MNPSSYYAAASRLSLSTSVLIAYVLALIVPAVAAFMAVAQARRMLRRARRAHQDFAASPRLAPGHATLLGTVETADGGHAVRLTVHQLPRAYRSRNSSGIRWTEVDREIDLRPFHLVLDSGERIRVRATDAVRLCDPLDRPVHRRNADERTRETIIENGARIHAVGVLAFERDESAASAGYRGGGKSWVLAASRRERLIFSKNPFEAMFQKKARFSILTAVAIAVGLGVVHLGLADFHALNVFGQVVSVHGVSGSTYTTQGKHGAVTHYRAEGTAIVDGVSIPVRDDTNHDLYLRLSLAGGDGGGRFSSLPFVVDAGASPPLAQIGTEPGLSVVEAMLVVFGLLAAATGYWAARKNALLWWEKKLVVDVEPNR